MDLELLEVILVLYLLVDTNEFIEFAFTQAGSARGISYFVQAAGNTNGNGLVGERILETFGVGGGSLGTVSQNSSTIFQVSSLFGNQAIKRFRLTSRGFDSFRVSRLTFAAPVPEPFTMFLFSTGLLGLMGYTWIRKHQEATKA